MWLIEYSRRNVTQQKGTFLDTFIPTSPFNLPITYCQNDSNQASQAATNIPLTGLTKGDNNDGDEEDEDEEAVDMEAYLNSSKPQTGVCSLNYVVHVLFYH